MEIAPERASRVLEAAGRQLASGVEMDSMLRILVRLTDTARGLILSTTIIERVEASAATIEKTFEALQAELGAFPPEYGPSPPGIPDDWGKEIQKWIQQTVSSAPRGNPGDAKRNALLLLGSFYRLAFRPDAVKPDNHAYDFISAWFAEFGSEMEAATERTRFRDQRKTREKEWKPSRETLRKSLRKHFFDPAIDELIDSWRIKYRDPYQE
jgi:hypothetical protein